MTQTFVTIAVPFDDARAGAVELFLSGQMGNPPQQAVRDALDRGGLIHFMSITVVRGDSRDSRAHLMFEINGDGVPGEIIGAVSESLSGQIAALFKTADIAIDPTALAAFLARHRHEVGQGWFSTPGLKFCGTPGMTVWRIKEEARLAKRVVEILDKPPADRALDTLERVRTELWAAGEKWGFIAEPAPLLKGTPSRWGMGITRSLMAAVADFLWPLLVLWVAAVACAWLFAGRWAAFWTGIVVALVEVAGLVAAYRLLRHQEKTDVPEDLPPYARDVAEVMSRENHCAQNHMAAVSVMKPGALRRLTLRIAFWFAAQIATWFSRPGFLAQTGDIHFARWILLPGTDKLLFFSNYDGAWESYLENFIELAHEGVTGVWSNTRGFPKTANLFSGGAQDGDRLRRWTRRQQRPSWFWYSAYPRLTAERIRINAAIRQGIACAATEADAADWLACFGSAPRPAVSIERSEVPTLVFGGLKRMQHGTALLLRLSADAAKNTNWLAKIAPELSYGDHLTADRALLVAFSQSGLRKLGLTDHQLATFPVPFQHGSAAPWRARALGDIGPDDPEKWLWGGHRTETDAVLLIYGKTETDFTNERALRIAQIEQFLDKLVATLVYEVRFRPLPSSGERPTEPFGFLDGISQPLIRGLRRPDAPSDAHHLVQPGEFVLGYPDNLGYIPPSPNVRDQDDPNAVLPALGADLSRQRPDFSGPQPTASRDLGCNGTYLVVRQIEQDVASFQNFVNWATERYRENPRASHDPAVSTGEWIAAKMVGRWKNGTSLVRHPHRPGVQREEERAAGDAISEGDQEQVAADAPARSKEQTAAAQRSPGGKKPKPARVDNDFLFGAEDPGGLKCPLGAHIRRANPRESFAPGSTDQLAITNRHRILRVGRPYERQNGLENPGLMFMCLNADIERQFEFLQQTWVMAPSFHGLQDETDAIVGHRSDTDVFTIPTEKGSLRIFGLKDFVKVRGSGYFFLPARNAIRFLARLPASPRTAAAAAGR